MTQPRGALVPGDRDPGNRRRFRHRLLTACFGLTVKVTLIVAGGAGDDHACAATDVEQVQVAHPGMRALRLRSQWAAAFAAAHRLDGL